MRALACACVQAGRVRGAREPPRVRVRAGAVGGVGAVRREPGAHGAVHADLVVRAAQRRAPLPHPALLRLPPPCRLPLRLRAVLVCVLRIGYCFCVCMCLSASTSAPPRTSPPMSPLLVSSSPLHPPHVPMLDPPASLLRLPAAITPLIARLIAPDCAWLRTIIAAIAALFLFLPLIHVTQYLLLTQTVSHTDV